MKIALLAGVVALAGLSSSASAQGGPPNPNCNACFDAIRTDVAAVGQQVSGVQSGVTQAQQGLAAVGQQVTGVQAGVTQSQQSLDQVWNGVGDVSRRVSGVDTQVRLVHDRVSNVQARATHIQDMSNQLLQAVAQANQTLGQIVATPPPPPVMKKSAVMIEIAAANLMPVLPGGPTNAVAKAGEMANTYCRGIGYASGKPLNFQISPPGGGSVQLIQLVCYD